MEETRTILYAEDDPDDFMIVSDMLQVYLNDISVKRVENGKEAIEYLNSLSAASGPYPCLIILDLNMPVMDGKETLIQLKNSLRFRNIPVIIFTTSIYAKDKLLSRQYNVPFITKPDSYDDLEPIIKQFVSHCEIGE